MVVAAIAVEQSGGAIGRTRTAGSRRPRRRSPDSSRRSRAVIAADVAQQEAERVDPVDRRFDDEQSRHRLEVRLAIEIRARALAVAGPQSERDRIAVSRACLRRAAASLRDTRAGSGNSRGSRTARRSRPAASASAADSAHEGVIGFWQMTGMRARMRQRHERGMRGRRRDDVHERRAAACRASPTPTRTPARHPNSRPSACAFSGTSSHQPTTSASATSRQPSRWNRLK